MSEPSPWRTRFFDLTLRGLTFRDDTLRIPVSERLDSKGRGFRWTEGYLVFDRVESSVRLDWKNGKTEHVARIESDDQFSRHFRDDWRDDKVHEFYSVRISIDGSDYLQAKYWNQTVYFGEKPEQEPINLAQAMIDFRHQLTTPKLEPETIQRKTILSALKRWLPWC